MIVVAAPESPGHWYCGDRTRKYLERLPGDTAQVRFNAPVTLSATERNPELRSFAMKPMGIDIVILAPMTSCC
ncbi:MAG: hypothetical protein QNJ46_14090 [Leptolyngbyaceae cyanobacterium MO_188.B28]|nr:hypothetical protein [Leptolyngbyaceae cyanobacterium MO_188.B28]